ncbi:MAG: UDP-N-acetylmuramate dehydrogenase [Lachnospiraceae bacterium]|nr:UDP-N-acetylmuramate dehydrogenase [Lachnospiraceae bacterium]
MLNNLRNYTDASRVEENVMMSGHTTFRVGGPAKVMVTVNSVSELKNVVTYLRKCALPYFILGNGSNLLVSDKGYDGVVLRLSGDFLKVDTFGAVIMAGAGASLGSVCKAALDNSLTGMEFAYGIPGTVGGAIVMNAGAYDGDMSMVVDGVEAVTTEGEAIFVAPHSLAFGYRTSAVRKAELIVTKVTFKLAKGDKDAIDAKMQELMGRRKDKQPLEYPSAGSTFKRPKDNFAGKLIEEAGLKGQRVGGACVSTKHCGFIINDDNATAQDISDLMDLVRQKVYDTSNVKLEPEVIKIGKF